MNFPPCYMLLAQQLGLRYWLAMGPGSYKGPITCPVDLVLRTARAALAGTEPPDDGFVPPATLPAASTGLRRAPTRRPTTPWRRPAATHGRRHRVLRSVRQK